MRLSVALLPPTHCHAGVGPVERPLVAAPIDVSASTLVADVVSEAVRWHFQFGALRGVDMSVEKLIEQVRSVDFARPGIDLTAVAAGDGQLLVGVAESGEIIVPDADYTNLTMSDLARAGHAGLIQGELAEPIVACCGQREVGLEQSWEFMLAALATVKFAADAAQAASDAQGLGVLLSRRRARRLAIHFIARGLLPSQLVRLIRKRKYWDTVRLAKYLQITAEEAADLLRAAGYEFAPGTKEWVRQLPDDATSMLEVCVELGENRLAGLPWRHLRKARRNHRDPGPPR